jgi:hypothetical protein
MPEEWRVEEPKKAATVGQKERGPKPFSSKTKDLESEIYNRLADPLKFITESKVFSDLHHKEELEWEGGEITMTELHETKMECEEGVFKYLLFVKSKKSEEKKLRMEIFVVVMDSKSEPKLSIEPLKFDSTLNGVGAVQLSTSSNIISSPNFLFFWKVTPHG